MSEKLRVLDLFSGIGGFSLGLERTGGFETVAFCEIEEFPRRVLAKHWPKVPCYHDVRELTADVLARDGIAVDVITGGFPCQDISVAGKQAGIGEGTRSGLWSEIVRLACELRPQFIIVENVANLLAGPSGKPGGWFGRILGDLAECGYDAEWENIPASALGAPHRRERIWLVAYPCERPQLRVSSIQASGRSERSRGISHEILSEEYFKTQILCQDVPNPNQTRLERWQEAGNVESIRPRGYQLFERCADGIRGIWEAEPKLGRVANGIPDWSHRLKSLGNSIVPQIPELIGQAILDAIKSERAAA